MSRVNELITRITAKRDSALKRRCEPSCDDAKRAELWGRAEALTEVLDELSAPPSPRPASTCEASLVVSGEVCSLEDGHAGNHKFGNKIFVPL